MKNQTSFSSMPKEISALNTYWLVQYLQENHPSVDIDAMIAKIASTLPCYVENLYSGAIEPVQRHHLLNQRYWFSHRFVQAMHDHIQHKIPDPRLGYRIGSTMYKTQPLIRTALGLSLLGIHRVADKVSTEAAKYNRTKEYSVRTKKRGYVEIRITHTPGIAVSEFTMQWNAGCFATYARLGGTTDINVTLHCIDPGPEIAGGTGQAIWDFKIHYQEPGLLVRLAKAILYCLPWIRKLTEDAERIEAEHQEQILHRDTIIKERTEKLISIQQRLMDEERRNIEQKLQDISRELVTTEERERRAIAEDLHDSVTQLLALSLSKVKSAQRSKFLKEELVEIRGYLEQALAELRSLTFQISPPVLYDFGLEAALEWLVQDVNTHRGMRLLFTNLLPSPLQAGRQEQVTLYRVLRECIINTIKHGKTRQGQLILRQEDEYFIAEVEDEGIGFDPATVCRGFGLSTMEDRLRCLNGTLQIEPIPGEGTFITITVPLDTLGSNSDQIAQTADAV